VEQSGILPPALEARRVTRRQALRGLGGLAALGFIVPVISACDSSAGGTTSTSGGSSPDSSGQIDTLNWAIGTTEIASLDLAKSTSYNSAVIYGLALEGLLAYDSNLKAVPVLAASWSQPDLLHYVFKIRPNVKFWDGSPLTADDVVYSLQRQMDPSVASDFSTSFAGVKSISSSGDTVEVALSTPNPLLTGAFVRTGIIPRAFGDKVGTKLGSPGNPVNIMGTGPYRVSNFSSNDGATVTANPTYWGPKPHVKQINFQCISDEQTVALAIQSGQIDGIFSISTTSSPSFKGLSNAVLYSAPGKHIFFLGLDVNTAPFSDIHVRKAMNLACDRDGLVKAYLYGYGQPAQTLVSPDEWLTLISQGQANSLYNSLPPNPFDISAAQSEMSQSAYASGFSCAVTTPSTFPELTNALVSYATDLKQLKIDLSVTQVPEATWDNSVYDHTYKGLAAAGVLPVVPDPSAHLLSLLPSSQAKPPGLNTADFSNSTVDQLLSAQAQTTDVATRVQDLTDVLKITIQQAPYVPLFFEDVLASVSNKYVYKNLSPYYFFGNWTENIYLQ
jgi:peptide/nickel transport system substrate-binding protein